MFIRTYNVLRQLSRSYDVRLLAFERTGPGASRDAAAQARAREGLSEFADVTVVPVPQASSRLRFLWDHLRSFFLGRVFTYYRHDHPEFKRLVVKELSNHTYDVIHVDSLDLASFLSLLPADRVALTHHNVESQLLIDRARMEHSPLLRAYVLRQAKLQKKTEELWCPKVHFNVMVSSRDAEELEKIAPGAATIVVPNGVDTETSHGNGTAGSDVVCVGGLSWFPNIDALDFLCEDVLPHFRSVLPEQLVWVGRATQEQIERYAARFGVRLMGYVDEALPFVERAACCVLPFRLGGGTRLKLLEAMAAGKAIVTTSVGAMGIDAENGRHLLIADTPSEFAAAVELVLADRHLASRLGSEARAMAEEVYDWNAIGKQMVDLYGQMN